MYITHKQLLNKRSTQQEMLDILKISPENIPRIIQNLEDFIRLNRKLKLTTNLSRGLDKIYHQNQSPLNSKTLRIADLASGAGDLTDVIYQWCQSKGLKASVTGFDINPIMTDYASSKYTLKNNIDENNTSIIKLSTKFKTANVLEETFLKDIQENYDIICINHFCHHLSDEEFIYLLRKLKNINNKKNEKCILINDIHRHFISYYFIKWYTRFFHYSNLTQQDGPLSVLKGFTRKELQHILFAAKIKSYQLSWVWPFHWQIIL